MARVAVQIGHVNGQSGAAYEEATLKLIFPFVLERIRSAGIQADPFDGSLQSEPGNNQYRYDVAVFLHCDSYTAQNTGYSIGYWTEQHPGSLKLAETLKDVYGKASGLKFIGYNITVGEWHYYGNRRFAHECKCVLIELGFVSNPSERAFLNANAKKLGYAVGDAVIKYLGVTTEEDDMWSNRADGIEPRTKFGAHFYAGLLNGYNETAYLAITNHSGKPTKVRVVVIPSLVPAKEYPVPYAAEPFEVDLIKEFKCAKSCHVEAVSVEPCYFTVDRRGTK